VTTMRSVEPMTGVDAVLSALFPFLNGTEPEPGEHGLDGQGNIYRWTGSGWQFHKAAQPVLAHPGSREHEAEAG
jgi:hypothetical protein